MPQKETELGSLVKEPKGREAFPFLEGVASEDTFRVAQQNLEALFIGERGREYKDSKGKRLLMEKMLVWQY